MPITTQINGRPPPGYARVAVIAFGFAIETFGLFLLTLVYAT
jgi:hypothetical protein